ncbi:hypothetical protein LCGC14_0845910 [marine sediment metagenome]|uniref:Uncharacterized protein n=1 Tax=marine sediment metagenome TaxID=412755 RepID=A0A0F9PBU6_9ZZZZ
MEYTKGERILNKEPYLGKDHYIIWIAGEGKIAEIIAPNQDEAQLMCSAPTMYEALEGISGWLVTSRNGKMPRMDSAIHAVRQALALAKGE